MGVKSEISIAARGVPRLVPEFSKVRARPWSRWQCRSDVLFALGASLVWLLFYNQRFWMETTSAMWHGSLSSIAFLTSLFVVVWLLQTVLLLLLPSRRLMLGAASVFFVIAAAAGYFSSKFGVVMNEDMLRNVFETDAAESRALLSAGLSVRLFTLGVVPAVLVWRVELPAMRWSSRLRQRGLAIGICLTLCVAALLSCSASYAVYFREHKPIRYSLVPAAPIASAIGLAFDKNRGGHGALINASGVAMRTSPPNAKPLVVVLVVGETARAANFQLGGYERNTNPELAALGNVVYFGNTTSCGTSTALSVPCMFSHLPRDSFDVDAAPRYANLADALQSAGLAVEWRDNNAGCKGVCARVKTIRYRPDTDAQRCPESYCYDEIMLEGFADELATVRSDTVVVMHQIGSHGPAYSERYPRSFEAFKPACHSSELQRCSPQEIRNAYDNTIAYTDHVLAQTIELLRAASDHVDAVLIYVSDHGESLGEQGLYLHGLPYAFAPDTQKRVPMLMWLAPSYAARRGIAVDCLASHAGKAFSHDNLYHTVLGAAEVRNASYNPALDILAPCGNARLPHDHE
jgi:lipid A ethanolaminephosphotransferase